MHLESERKARNFPFVYFKCENFHPEPLVDFFPFYTHARICQVSYFKSDFWKAFDIKTETHWKLFSHQAFELNDDDFCFLFSSTTSFAFDDGGKICLRSRLTIFMCLRQRPELVFTSLSQLLDLCYMKDYCCCIWKIRIEILTKMQFQQVSVLCFLLCCVFVSAIRSYLCRK